MVLSPPFPGLSRTSLVAHMVKRLPTIQETRVLSLGWEDLLEKEMATHSSILAWKIPWMEEPGGLQSMGSQRVGHEEQLPFLGLISPFHSTLGSSVCHCLFVPHQHHASVHVLAKRRKWSQRSEASPEIQPGNWMEDLSVDSVGAAGDSSPSRLKRSVQ